MVKSLLGIFLAGTSLPVIAGESSISAVDVSKGEILLEIIGTGKSVQKLTRVSSFCTLTHSANTLEEARAKLEASQAEIRSGLNRNMTVDFIGKPTSSEVERFKPIHDIVADAAAPADEVPEIRPAEAKRRPTREKFTQYTFTQTVNMSATSIFDFYELRNITSRNQCNESYRARRNLQVEAADPSAGKQIALKAAIANSRLQAKKYADAMNMRVKGIIRVSEANPIQEFLGDDLAKAFRQELDRDARRRRAEDFSTNEIELLHSVSVDFVLEPK